MAADRPRALITYDGLPLSAGGAHRIRGKDRAATWRTLVGFLSAFTTYREPDDVRLLLAEGPRVDPGFFEAAHRRASAAYGPPEQRLAISGAVEEREHRWTLEPTDVADALELMTSLEPFPAHWLDAPLVLSIDCAFRLCDPDTGQAFPGQDPELYGFQEADAIVCSVARRYTCG